MSNLPGVSLKFEVVREVEAFAVTGSYAGNMLNGFMFREPVSSGLSSVGSGQASSQSSDSGRQSESTSLLGGQVDSKYFSISDRVKETKAFLEEGLVAESEGVAVESEDGTSQKPSEFSVPSSSSVSERWVLKGRFMSPSSTHPKWYDLRWERNADEATVFHGRYASGMNINMWHGIKTGEPSRSPPRHLLLLAGGIVTSLPSHQLELRPLPPDLPSARPNDGSLPPGLPKDNSSTDSHPPIDQLFELFDIGDGQFVIKCIQDRYLRAVDDQVLTDGNYVEVSDPSLVELSLIWYLTTESGVTLIRSTLGGLLAANDGGMLALMPEDNLQHGSEAYERCAFRLTEVPARPRFPCDDLAGTYSVQNTSDEEQMNLNICGVRTGFIVNGRMTNGTVCSGLFYRMRTGPRADWIFDGTYSNTSAHVPWPLRLCFSGTDGGPSSDGDTGVNKMKNSKLDGDSTTKANGDASSNANGGDTGAMVMNGDLEAKTGVDLEEKSNLPQPADASPVTLRQFSGESHCGEKSMKWVGRRDDYLTLSSAKDYSQQWAGGKQICSSAASSESLDGLLEHFMCPQILDGKNKYYCSECDQLRKAERFSRISLPPAHLFITLKRFSFDYRSGRRSKIFKQIDVPAELELPFQPAADEKMDESGDEKAEEKEIDVPVLERRSSVAKQSMEKAKYGLYAVVVHSGHSADVGHYYCIGRDSSVPDICSAESVLSPWYKYDDIKVTKCSFEELQRLTNKSPLDSAYLIFYRRMDNTVPVPDSAAIETKSQIDFTFSRSLQLAPNILSEIAAENRQLLIRTSENQCPQFSDYILTKQCLPPADFSKSDRPVPSDHRILSSDRCSTSYLDYLSEHHTAQALSRVVNHASLRSVEICVRCGAEIMRAVYAHHLVSECTKRDVQCHSCGEIVPAFRLEDHISKCPYVAFQAVKCRVCSRILPSHVSPAHARECIRTLRERTHTERNQSLASRGKSEKPELSSPPPLLTCPTTELVVGDTDMISSEQHQCPICMKFFPDINSVTCHSSECQG
eukprot:236859_1